MSVADAMLRTLATALPDMELPGGVPHLAAAEARLAGGVAALEGETLLTGAALVLNVELLVAALGPAASPEVRAVGAQMRAHLPEGTPNELVEAAQSRTWDAIEALASRIGLDPKAVVTLVDFATRPALRAGARAVREAVARSHWRRGTCPACGSAPLLAELRGGGASGTAEHERLLRCGRCLSAWSFPRLRCVSCGETNHRKLAYLHGTGEESFRRAEVCSSCHGYVKSIAVLASLDFYQLLSTDLTTAPLDAAAIEHGFHRT